MNKNCELIIGPCTCGAWHSVQEIEDIKKENEFLHRLNKQCKHDWLKPEGLKTTCVKCGRDGWISLDTEDGTTNALIKALEEIEDLGRTRSGRSTESRLAANALVQFRGYIRRKA